MGQDHYAVKLAIQHIPYRARDGAPGNQADPWVRISIYQSRDLIWERFKERHDRDASDGLCRTISSQLRQGQQFFESAKDAGEMVRPILIYYGVLALARALILFDCPSKRVDDLAQAHGLSAVGWSGLFKEGNASAILPELRIRITDGTFSELGSTTKNAEWTQSNWDDELRFGVRSPKGLGSLGWLAEGTHPLPDEREITLGEALRRVPDLAFLWEETMGEPAACFPADILILRGARNMGPNFPPTDRRVEISLIPNFLPLPALDELSSMFEFNLRGFQALEPAGQQRRNFAADLANGRSVIARLPPVRVNKHWSDYLVAPLRDGLILSTMSTLFLVSFAIGSLARYYPTAWQGMTVMRKGDRSYPVLKEAVACVERQFPREVADYFERNVPVGHLHELPNSA